MVNGKPLNGKWRGSMVNGHLMVLVHASFGNHMGLSENRVYSQL